MVKEPKDIDFLTSGRQPSEQDFERISDWIRKKKIRLRIKGVGRATKNFLYKKRSP